MMRRSLLLPLVLCGATVANPAAGATGLSELRYAPDIPVTLGTPGTLVRPATVGVDSLSGPVTLISPGGIPSGARIAAYHRTNNGDHLLVFDTTVRLGGATYNPRQVVRYDGSGYSLYFDGVAAGVPAGARISGISLVGDALLLLSFDVTVALGGVTYLPRDIASFHGGTSFSKYFDGSGVGANLRLQDFHSLDSNGHLLLSFDGGGTLGGVPFTAADVLEFTPGGPCTPCSTGTFEMAYRAAAHDAGWRAAHMLGLWAQAAPPGNPGILQFALTQYTVDEGGTAIVSVTRSGGSTGSVSVGFHTADGTATAPAEYTASAGTLTWADGDTSVKTIAVATSDDHASQPAESNDTVNLILTAPTGGASLGPIAIATLLIVEANPLPPAAPLVSFSTYNLNFGIQPVGTTSVPRSVLLTNTGDAPVSLIGFNAPGGDFLIIGNTCAASLDAGASCTLTLTFAPSAPGIQSAVVAVTDSAQGSPHLVELVGEGVGAGSAKVIPALSPWSLVLLGGLLGLWGAWSLRRRRW